MKKKIKNIFLLTVTFSKDISTNYFDSSWGKYRLQEIKRVRERNYVIKLLV